MFVMKPSSSGTVVAMRGKAVARAADGRLRMLSLGDPVGDDEVVLTAQNGFVQIATSDGAAGRAAPGRVVSPPEPVAPVPAGDPAGAAALQSALRLDGLAERAGEAPGVAAGAAAGSGTAAAVSATVSHHAAVIDRLAPRADALRYRVAEDTPLPVSLTGHDPDGGVARVFVVKVPTGGLLWTAEGEPIADRTALTPGQARELVFVPAPNFHGNPGPLQFIVEDQVGRRSPVATVAIEVTPVNDAPLPGTLPIGPDLVPYPDPDPHLVPGTGDYRHATFEGTPVTGQVHASDVDLDPLRFFAAEAPRHGEVVVGEDGRFVYTPEAGFRGEDRFEVAVDDGHGGVARSTVFIDVAPVGSAIPAAPVDAVVPLAAIPVGVAQELSGPLPLAFDEVFAWSLAESGTARAPTTDVSADVLQLSALLVGHLPASAAPAMPDLRLDLGLDWGLRTSGLDLWRDGAAGRPLD